ncbi:MAG: KH domain-containing protein [archaeon YNP-WB-040]|jgi:ribosomal RNA assembly protein|nr:KH domain-containing protein [Candidatus Culexarchaeum yellowstonense]
MGEGGRRVIREYVSVPPDRIGVVIGDRGTIKSRIEESTGVALTVDSSSSSVMLEIDPDKTPYENMMKAKNIITAIGYGFSPEKAFKLLEDDVILDVIDLTLYVGTSKNHLTRIKGRIIGENGKTRKIIEEYTGTFVSVYSNYVAIIGTYENVSVARRAVEMLASGKPHNAVYSFLDREKRRLKKLEFELWEKRKF